MTTLAINAPRTELLTRTVAGIATFFALTGAALRCAAAVEDGRRPSRADLDALGIGELSYPDHPCGR